MRIRNSMTAVSVLGLLAMVAAGVAMPWQARAQGSSSYESPTFGYVVQWDPAWAARDRETVSDNDVDTLVLTNNDGRIEVVGQQGDSATDAVTATVERLAPSPEIVNQDDSSETPSVEFTSGRYHYLVQGYTVGDAVVVVSLRARDTTFDYALAVAKGGVTIESTPVLSDQTIVVAEPTSTPEATPEASPVIPAGTPVPSGDSGLNGSTFTSPGFGFTLEVPDGWTVDHEAIAQGDEQLALTNGTSLVTLHTTSQFSGELATCVTWAEALVANDGQHEDMKLSVTTAGQPFQGADDLRAYARYQYSDPDGTTTAYYVSCERLNGDAGFLIVTQQVPMDQFDAERGAWRQVRNVIVQP